MCVCVHVCKIVHLLCAAYGIVTSEAHCVVANTVHPPCTSFHVHLRISYETIRLRLLI